MYQQAGGNSEQNSYLRLACFFQLKISKSSEATRDSVYKQLPPGAACLTPTVRENTLRFWEYLLYLMRPQLYQFVCKYNTKHRDEVAFGVTQEGNLPIKNHALKVTCGVTT